MSKSIMQDNKQSYLSGRTDNLHKHHIFEGNPNRKNSEEYGCWIWLTADEHNMSDQGVHFNKQLDLRLKCECQRKFEAIYGHKKFKDVFGRYYL
jgi:hypothetical protein